MFDESDLDRRSVLQGAGAMASAALFADAMGEAAAESDADGQPATEIPEESRTVEGGLSLFVTKWNAVGAVIANTQQFGTYLSGKTFNLYVADDDRAYRVELGPEGGASFNQGADPRAHASLAVDREDWLDILYGEYTGLAPAIEGRTFAPRSEVNTGGIFAIVVSVLAHLPVSTAQDLGSNAKLLRGIVRRQGQTDCGSDIGDGQIETADERMERLARGPENRAPDVTEELAVRSEALSYDDLPEKAVERAKTQLKSILGVMYAATTLEPAQKLTAAMEDMSDGTEATAVAGDRTFNASAEQAALTNSYLAQMLEWEDWTFMAHTGAMVVPTALAAAEAAGASGKELITAIVLGDEIAGRVGYFLTDPTNLGQALPVHQSELPFVAGKLFGLGVEELQDASGLAGAQPQTPTIATWPAEGKGLIGGEPARSSVQAAKFADAGLHGKRDHLENVGGYWYRLADIHDPRHLAFAYEGLGEEFLVTDEYFNKRYPCDGFTQTAVHAILNVREQLLADGCDPEALPDAIEKIEVGMNSAKTATGSLFGAGEYEKTVGRVVDDEKPDWSYTTLLFDGTYPLAAALLDGELTHRQYQPDRIDDPEIEALHGRFEQATDLSVGQFGAEVTVVLEEDFAALLGEREYQSFVGCMRSDVMDGWTGSKKLERTASDVIGSQQVQRIDDAVEDLESVENVRQFTTRL